MIRINKSIKNKDLLFLTVIVIVHLAIAIPLSLYLNIWEDEAYTLNTTSHGLVYAWTQSIRFEAQPPVYFLLLSAWRMLSQSIFFARLFSIIISIVALILMYFIVKKYISEKYAFFITLLLSVHPYMLWAATEIRAFIMVIMFSALLIFLFLKTYMDEKPGLNNRLLFIAVAILGINCQYYVGFLLFALGVVIFFTKGIKRFIAYGLDMVAPLITILYFLKAILYQLSIHETIHPAENHLSIIDLIKFWPIRLFDYSLTFNLTDMAIGFWIFRGIIILLAALTIIKSIQTIKQNFTKPHLAIFITVFVIIVFFSGVFFVLGTEYVSEKYTAVLFPPFVLAFYILITKTIKPKFIKVWLVVILFLLVSASIVKYSEPVKVYDIKGLCRYIKNSEKPGEPVFVYRNTLKLLTNYYYKGTNEVIPVPRKFDFSMEFCPAQWALTKEEVKDFFTEHTVGIHSFWLVTEETKLDQFDESLLMIENYVKVKYRMEAEKYFTSNLKAQYFEKIEN